jgi:hypothetical protein
MGLIEVTDFSSEGWATQVTALEQSIWCCERLEDAEVLWFPAPLFKISENDRRFLCDVKQSGSGPAKNISYNARTGHLEGYTSSAGDGPRIARMLSDYSESIRDLAATMLSPYARHLQPDLTSFRPIEEEGRTLPMLSRNDLIHIDAFPNRPARDRRILRFFTNLHFSKPRIWLTTDSFQHLAHQMALDAGLRQCAFGEDGLVERLKQALLSAAPSKRRSASLGRTSYDRFMLRFHDYLKMNAGFQDSCPKTPMEFPPGSTWVAFTDAVPHAVMSGVCALEQTFFLPVASMLDSRKSPLRILESLVGAPLV